MISARMRDDSSAAIFIAQREQRIERASDLECSDRMQVFGLEHHTGRRHANERRRIHKAAMRAAAARMASSEIIPVRAKGSLSLI